MAVDLRQLRYLIAAAEAGSITDASQRLYISQPALTAALRKLEHDVGVALLVRHPRGVTLTAAGEAFVERAKVALDMVAEATLSAQRIGDPAGCQLIIGLLPATFSAVPRAIVAAFHAQHPNVRVRYRELSYISHTTDLIAGRIDAALLWPPYDEPELQFLPLAQEPRLLGTAMSHHLADHDSVLIDEILDLAFPGYHKASSGAWFKAWFFDDYRHAPARLTSDEAATPFEMALVVHEGRAIAPAAQSFALAFPSPGVRWLPLIDAPPATLALAWHPANRNPATAAFIRTAHAAMDLPRHLELPKPKTSDPRVSDAQPEDLA